MSIIRGGIPFRWQSEPSTPLLPTMTTHRNTYIVLFYILHDYIFTSLLYSNKDVFNFYEFDPDDFNEPL